MYIYGNDHRISVLTVNTSVPLDCCGVSILMPSQSVLLWSAVQRHINRSHHERPTCCLLSDAASLAVLLCLVVTVDPID